MIPYHPTLFKVLRGSFQPRALPQSDIEVKPMLVQCHNLEGILDVIPKLQIVELMFALIQGA